MATDAGVPEPQPPAPRGFRGRLNAALRMESVSWLVATFLQLLLTWVFLVISEWSRGAPWEGLTAALVLMGIIASWGMALRAIHARIGELLRFWRVASAKLLRQAAARGDMQLPEELERRWQTVHVRKSLVQLRIIAAGLTLPFFVLPLFASLLCVVVALHEGMRAGEWALGALLYWFLAAIVGAYFHWSIMPVPARRRKPLRAPRHPGLRPARPFPWRVWWD